MNSKKIIASTVIFFFSNFISPPVMAATLPARSTDSGPIPKKTEERPLVIAPPRVHISAPRYVIPQLGHQGEKVVLRHADAVIWTIPYSLSSLQVLKEQPLHMRLDRVVPVQGTYSNAQGAYVNMIPCTLTTGLLEIQQPQSTLERNLAPLLVHPEKYRVGNEWVTAAFFPKIVQDVHSGLSLLIMEPVDFRLSESPHYTKGHLEYMLNVSYAALKGYMTLQQGKPQEKKSQSNNSQSTVHTSFWGGQYKNNVRTTTVIQLMAAELAGVNRLLFYTGNAGPVAAHKVNTILDDAVVFVQQHSGLKVSDILDQLHQNTAKSLWQAAFQA